MNGLLVLFLSILIAALPVFLVYLWFRISRYPVSLPRFLFFLVSGAAALFLALLLQRLFPAAVPANTGTAAVIFNVFCKIALTEELGRLLMLLLFFRILRLTGKDTPFSSGTPGSGNEPAWGAVAGLIAGLGFSLIESASYGAANPGIAFLRAFTAAPLHGACGARVGTAAAVFRDRPLPALLHFLSAAAIHGMYNFMILLPGIPTVLAILTAFSALGSSVLFINGVLREAKGEI